MIKVVQLVLLVGLVTVAAGIVCNATHPFLYGNECFEECPWNSTIVTYLNNSTKICGQSIIVFICLDCSGGTFADDASKTCVSGTLSWM